MRVGANRTHSYEDRATGKVYVIPGGEVREVPDQIGRTLIDAHPAKLYDADAAAGTVGRLADTSADNRMVDVKPPNLRKGRGGRRPKTR